MSDPAPILNSPSDEASREILDLADAIAQLPVEYRLRIEPLVNRVLENARRRRRILSLVQDALGQLRLDMKYLTFDLEATRRERDDYRQKLEGST
ncbi:MAG: transcriptional regulator [Thermoguttaceae bacterium]